MIVIKEIVVVFIMIVIKEIVVVYYHDCNQGNSCGLLLPFS